ncbi:MAG: hypothetical protein O2923_02940 [Verrucomicrobia bacterium]|nr:hypothetical protein [Verrucomicrobiota bacterium]MDA1086416.1 hypothetical protein [Verrucomicrobiota bacterium]
MMKLHYICPPAFAWLGIAAGALLWSHAAAALDMEKINGKARQVMDTTHAHVSSRVQRTANKIDSFFGNERIDDEAQGGRVRVRSSLEYGERGDLNSKIKVRAKLALPNLEERFNLVFGTEDDDGIVNPILNSDDIAGLVDEVDDADYSSALRYIIAATEKWNTSLDGGFKFRTDVDPFGRARTRRTFELDGWSMRATERITWIEDDGWKSESSIAAERNLTDSLFFRAGSQATWREHKDGAELEQGLGVTYQIDDHRAVTLQGGVRSVTRPANTVEEYGASLRYRKQFYKEWLYYEIEPRASFPDERDFRFTPTIAFIVEMIFGDPR